MNNYKGSDITCQAAEVFKKLTTLSQEDLINTINKIRSILKEYSPFKGEPIDCVQWINIDKVTANDYNPNSVAPPEMKLLELSIQEDGYTQPVVAWKKNEQFEIVDGFHRNRVARENKNIKKRILGHLPLAIINEDRSEKSDRMASTIRHNRARGKHSVDSMSDIVVELKKRNRSEKWIADHLGMDADEVLRLCQVSGLTEMFSNTGFSKSWDLDDLNNTIDEQNLELEDKENE